jgi:hypothetical protein
MTFDDDDYPMLSPTPNTLAVLETYDPPKEKCRLIREDIDSDGYTILSLSPDTLKELEKFD